MLIPKAPTFPLSPIAKANAAPEKTASAPGSTQGLGPKADAKIGDAALIGITVRKDLDFPEWYTQVLRKGDMLDYYDVSGCYILKPWSYNVWQSIQGECAQFDTHAASRS